MRRSRGSHRVATVALSLCVSASLGLLGGGALPAAASTSHSTPSFDVAISRTGSIAAGTGTASFQLVKMTKAERKAKRLERRKARKAKREQKRHAREQRMKQKKQQQQ